MIEFPSKCCCDSFMYSDITLALRCNIQVEWELKFINVDAVALRQKLTELGGTRVLEPELFPIQFYTIPEKALYRPGTLASAAADEIPTKTILSEDHVDGFGRVRKEGDKTTLTIKKFRMIGGNKMAEEYEVKVDSFVGASEVLDAAGFTKQQFQEKYREKWTLPSADVNEIVLDTYPGLKMYIEVECTSEEAMLETCKSLGFDPKDSLSGHTDDVYSHVYGINGKIFHGQGATFGFHNTADMIGPHVTKNKELFDAVVAEQAGLVGTYSSL